MLDTQTVAGLMRLLVMAAARAANQHTDTVATLCKREAIVVGVIKGIPTRKFSMDVEACRPRHHELDQVI